MESIWVNARAKINLALDVIGKREDGYHDLRTIMQSVELHDRIEIKKVSQYSLKLVTDDPCLPTDEKNLVVQAAAYCQKEFGLDSGLFIGLRKTIPLSAGLAGGSSDCAAVLSGLNQLFDLRLSLEDLMAMGRRFGADVPFCLMGGAALAEGIGDKLMPLPPHPPVSVVIAKPPEAISTAWVFQEFRRPDEYPDIHPDIHPDNRLDNRPDILRMLACMESGDIRGLAAGFYNALESVTVPVCPDIPRLKEIFLEAGALGTLMSGSGPSVFAYFADWREARRSMYKIKKRMPHVRQVFLTETSVRGAAGNG
ncbi:MAG: 4-(cytidine 5'-diphospho)-2-C-methyl-D-erythritol kinase [Clostridiales bacterium]|jgi:4-diphosphocytidyl-2-C-methyl-D-erythritol kinase|nr:4-(cytidine 5'-diphospho)-2-C-methyl-D-erythritol kinase [Clostridiales bacterium]